MENKKKGNALVLIIANYLTLPIRIPCYGIMISRTWNQLVSPNFNLSTITRNQGFIIGFMTSVVLMPIIIVLAKEKEESTTARIIRLVAIPTVLLGFNTLSLWVLSFII